jgi:hypothetical protein
MFSGSVSQLQKRALHTAACKTPAEENLMRSRIIWTIVASGVVLIGIGLMHFSLTALQEPSPLETRIANLAKHSVIRLPAATEFPRRQLTKEAASKQEVHISAWIAASAAGSTAGPKHHRDSGCTHVPQISPVTECRAIPIRELFWIINNGIRFTGMLDFGRIEAPDQIWGLVKYMRTLPGTNTSGLPGRIDSFRNRQTARPGKGE